jgi:hypothetical protein
MVAGVNILERRIVACTTWKFEQGRAILINSIFEKVNTYLTCRPYDLETGTNSSRYKTYRCETHNKFFEVNLYQKNPINTHHWRATLARPSRDIDLAYRRRGCETVQGQSAQETKQEFLSTDTKGKAANPISRNLQVSHSETQYQQG